MALNGRHPRLMITLLILIFVCVLLFVNSVRHNLLHNPTGCQRGGGLAVALATEEIYYQKMLLMRQDLIKKWGPTADQVDSFPSDLGDFYTVWDFFLPSFKCPHHLQRVGIMGDGGKWVCGLERIVPKKKCVMYSFGISEESSFEADIMKAVPGCEVYGYDFSVNSFGPEIELESDLKRRSHFFPFALGLKDGFGETDDPKMYTLRTLMEQNGHDFIDVLKIDVEGNEFGSLEVFIDSFHGQPLPFGQLQLEIHIFFGSEMEYFPKFLKWWEKLEAAGLRPFFSEPNLVYMNLIRGMRPDLIEYSFINIRGSHELVTNHPLPPRRISQ